MDQLTHSVDYTEALIAIQTILLVVIGFFLTNFFKKNEQKHSTHFERFREMDTKFVGQGERFDQKLDVLNDKMDSRFLMTENGNKEILSAISSIKELFAGESQKVGNLENNYHRQMISIGQRLDAHSTQIGQHERKIDALNVRTKIISKNLPYGKDCFDS